MYMQERVHRRKSLHPHRAAESVAEDEPESPPSTQHPNAPGTPPQKPSLERSGPERIHAHHKVAGGVRKAAPRSARPAPHAAAGNKICGDCGATKTPMWRRVENETYCNACGLRRKRAESGR